MSAVRSVRALFAVVAAIALILTVRPFTAQAATYEVWSCVAGMTEYARNGDAWWMQGYGPYLNHCPDGLDFDGADALQIEGYSEEWEWNGSLGPEVKRITLTLHGGDSTGGIKYSIVTRTGLDREKIADLPDRAPGDPDVTKAISLPDGVTSISIMARCEQAVCSGNTKLRISSIRLRLDDSQAPRLWLETTPTLSATSDGLSSDEVPWVHSDVMRLSANATDEGSGVAAAAIRFDDRVENAWQASPKCEPRWDFLNLAPPAIAYDRPSPCPPRVDSVTLLDLAYLSEGRHKLTFTASDEMGNSPTPETGWFGIDNTDPAPPAFAKISQTPVNEHGWTDSGFYAAYTSEPPPTGPNESPVGDVQASITRDDIPGATLKTNANGVPRAFPSEGHFRIDTWFRDGAGNKSSSTPAFVGYDTTTPPRPALHENDWVSRQELIDGYEQDWDELEVPKDVESGICGYVTSFDKTKNVELEGPETVSGNVHSAPVKPGLVEGVNYAHVASVSCAGKVSATAQADLPVDATAPTIEIDGLSPNEWDDELAQLRLTPSDPLSGVATIYWSVDDGPAQSSTSAQDVTLPEGQHTLSVWAEDEAGNVSDPEAFVIGSDLSGPAAWISGTQTAPGVFTANVKDELSGIDSAALQYRRVDGEASSAERQWRQIGAAYLPGGATTEERSFSRELDAASLADGSYELRVTAIDRAGNVGHGGQLDGGSYTVDLPLLPRPVGSLAVADMVRRCTSNTARGCKSSAACRKGARCTFRWVASRRGAGIDRIVDFSRREALLGSVLTPGGEPLGGAMITIYQRVGAGGREVAGHATTDVDGNYEWRVPSGPSRRFEAVTELPGFAAATATATLTVRAGVSLTVSDRSVRSRQRVVFSGRLGGGSLGIPLDGRTIQIEYWSEGQWKSGLARDETDASGRYRAVWHVSGVSVAGSLIVRAKADSRPSETAWPFATGKSPQLRIKLRP